VSSAHGSLDGRETRRNGHGEQGERVHCLRRYSGLGSRNYLYVP
jgi:hypothetical protein